MPIYQLINEEITNIKEYSVPDPNNLNPDEYQQHLEELPKQVEKLGNIKKLLEVQKGFGVVDKYLTANNLKPSGVEAILDIITVNRQEDITKATLIFEGDLYLRDIRESIDAIRILGNIQTVTGDLNLMRLTSAVDLVLPSSLVGSLSLISLTSAKDLVFPSSIGGDLDLTSLTSAKDLVFPSSIGGDLYVTSLTSAKGLVLPSSVTGNLYLTSLSSAVDLVLPTSIGGNLDLRSLSSLDGLELPPGYVGPVYLPRNLKLDAEQDPRFTGVTINTF